MRARGSAALTDAFLHVGPNEAVEDGLVAILESGEEGVLLEVPGDGAEPGEGAVDLDATGADLGRLGAASERDGGCG